MSKIGIVGANGFLGIALSKCSTKYEHDVIKITKDNFDEHRKDFFDILINTATPSKKYWAYNNPYLDFQASVSLTADLVYNWNYQKMIHISTMSVNELNTKHPYSINKKAAEIIASYKNSLIVRLSNLYGEGLSRGPLYDLLNNKKVYVDINSEYSFISTEFVAKWIFENLHKEGIVQIGAKDTISLSKIAKKLNLKIDWEGRLERIYSSEIEPGMPSSEEVLYFINKYYKNK